MKRIYMLKTIKNQHLLYIPGMRGVIIYSFMNNEIHWLLFNNTAEEIGFWLAENFGDVRLVADGILPQTATVLELGQCLALRESAAKTWKLTVKALISEAV